MSHKTFLQHPKLYGSSNRFQTLSHILFKFQIRVRHRKGSGSMSRPNYSKNLSTCKTQGPKLVWWLYDHEFCEFCEF
ncbi:hypothetical protein P8452_70413 [Trifolium repens]|nr:hypothetical protein QL285_051847 [Trifolium repens]WJX19072.1 hypothetical protein P8452_08805 [Trifolium repens]WJX88308.1 hypothetical protein P8452_70413 [Trifolium repens]